MRNFSIYEGLVEPTSPSSERKMKLTPGEDPSVELGNNLGVVRKLVFRLLQKS